MMNSKRMPQTPSRRRVIVVVDQHEYDRMQYEGGARILLDSQSVVVNIDDPPEGKIVEALEASNLLNAGQVLVQNPYQPDRYVPLSTATADIAVSKHHFFTQLCFLLGAKSVSVEQLEGLTAEKCTAYKTKAKEKGVGLDVAGDHKEAARLAKQLTINAQYHGGAADIEAAETLLRERRLLGDRHLESLLEMRRHEGNSLKEHTVVVSLTDEAKSNLKVAARLSAPMFSFSSEIESSTSQSVEFRLTVKVRF